MQEIRWSEQQGGLSGELIDRLVETLEQEVAQPRYRGFSRELIDRLVARESPTLDRVFASRRAEALKRPGPVTIRETRRIGRNDPCPCGSGLKFKKCCGRNLAADDQRVG